ncbi:hypothetical protein ACI792_20635 [Blastococcus sp. SYSU DS0669]
MNRTEPRTPATLPPVTLTPEEAAAVAAALAARPEGPYAEAGQTALEKVLTALEPDPAQRARLLASSRWLAADVARGAEVRRRVERGLAHPAGHRLPRTPPPAAPPRLRVLPGGRA